MEIRHFIFENVQKILEILIFSSHGNQSKKMALGNRALFQDSHGMSQSQIDVRYVANLARLELTDAEVAEFQPQLEAILRHVETLSKLNVSDIDATTVHSSHAFGRLRDDTPHPSLTPETVLQNAPDQAQGQIRVPKVVTDA